MFPRPFLFIKFIAKQYAGLCLNVLDYSIVLDIIGTEDKDGYRNIRHDNTLVHLPDFYTVRLLRVVHFAGLRYNPES